MIIDVFNSYTDAKETLSAFINGAKRHPGLRGIEYKIYPYYGKYAIYRGRAYSDFPDNRGCIFAVRVR